MTWRRVNLLLACAWLTVIPISLALGWLRSILFVSAISLYANVAAHVAAWRSDVPNHDEGDA